MRVLTIGTFDLFHAGHLNLLLRCQMIEASELHVGVNSDRFVSLYKGQAPIVGELERMRIVEHVKGVDAVHLNDGPGRALIEELAPQIIAVGSDWHGRDYLDQIAVEQRWIDEHQVSVIYLPRTPDVSSTGRRQQVAA